MPLSTVYATDEDILVRIWGDVSSLLPRSQDLVYCLDGQIAAGTPWTLTSATEDFAARGVAPRNIAILTHPTPASRPAWWQASGEFMVVDSVASGQIILRRPSLAAGVGKPPGTGSLLQNIRCQILTFFPQIEEQSYELNRRFSIGEPGREVTRLEDIRQLRKACVLMVADSLYFAAWSQTTNDLWQAKRAALREDLDSALAALTVTFSNETRESRPYFARCER